MKKIVRNILIFLITIIFLIAFSSSYAYLSIDNLAYVLAMGIDTSDNNKLKVTFQFSTTASITESGSSQKSPPVNNTVEASSLSNAINLMNGYIGKQLNLSHCKIIIFSEEFARQGISSEIYTLINNSQIRPSANIVISKCDSSYYINNTKPELENLVAKYYEILTNSSKYTGYMPDATIGNFFNALKCKTCEPYAILGSINDDSSQSSTNINSQKDYSVKADESSIESTNGSENIGVAVFKNDKLIGELNALETISFLSIRNQIDSFFISVPDPDTPNSYIDLVLKPDVSTSIKVNIANGTPYIKIKSKFNGRIYSMSDNSKYSDTANLDIISQSCNSYLESVFSNYLYKTSKELKADINGFGKSSLSNFLTTKEFDDYNWLENYKNAFFDVEVDTSVKSSMLLIET